MEPFVLQLDQLLFPLRELLVPVRDAALHPDEPFDRVGEGPLPLGGQLLPLHEGLDLPLGVLQVTGQFEVEPLHPILVLLDRLLPFVQGAGPILHALLLGPDPFPVHPDRGEVVVNRAAAGVDLLLLLLEFLPLGSQALGLTIHLDPLGLEFRLPRVEFLLARFERVLRLLEPRCGCLHRVDEEWGGLVTGHVRSPPSGGTTSLGCLPDYISRGPRESCLRTFGPRGDRPQVPDPGSVLRGHPAIRMDGLSRCVRQTKDTYKGPCRTVVSTPPMGGVRTRDGNMPALKEISFEYARQIASVKGLQPGKVRGTSTLRFTKGDSDKLQVITWDEFVQTANNRNLAVYESGGWMKLMRKH